MVCEVIGRITGTAAVKARYAFAAGRGDGSVTNALSVCGTFAIFL